MTEALRRAARRALAALPVRPDAVILDGKHDYIGAPWPVRLEVKGDAASISVAAASVLAKVRRDAYMATHRLRRVRLRRQRRLPVAAAPGGAGPPRARPPHHRLSWSYLDDLPRWRHLKQHRDPLAGEGQASLFG